MSLMIAIHAITDGTSNATKPIWRASSGCADALVSPPLPRASAPRSVTR